MQKRTVSYFATLEDLGIKVVSCWQQKSFDIFVNLQNGKTDGDSCMIILVMNLPTFHSP
jgi:hypothetical protein